MKKLAYIFSFVMLLVLSFNTKGQDSRNDINPNLYEKSGNPRYEEGGDLVLGDILRNHNVDSLITVAQGYGVEWTGNYYVVSNFSLNMVYKIAPDWSLIQALPITGGTGTFRDMEFAKGFLWGVSATNFIRKIDTTTMTQVASITLPAGVQARALAWDEVRHGFWTSTLSFNGFMRLYDTNGVAVPNSDIPVANQPGAFYGAAYDGVSPGGPYLIIASDATPTTANSTKWTRWNIATLPPTRVDSIKVIVPLTSGSPSLASGGCDFTTTLVPNKSTIIGLVQGTPDRVVVVEIDDLTGISGNTSLVPKSYSLNQNYPNPFNPSTTFSFGLPKDSDARLFITDVLGREVEVISSGFKKAGTYTVTYNASGLSSGIYFYSLVTSDFRETKKMLLVK